MNELSRTEVAKHLNVTQSTVQLWADLVGLEKETLKKSYDQESVRILETVKDLRQAERGYNTIVKIIQFDPDRNKSPKTIKTTSTPPPLPTKKIIQTSEKQPIAPPTTIQISPETKEKSVTKHNVPSSQKLISNQKHTRQLKRIKQLQNKIKTIEQSNTKQKLEDKKQLKVLNQRLEHFEQQVNQSLLSTNKNSLVKKDAFKRLVSMVKALKKTNVDLYSEVNQLKNKVNNVSVKQSKLHKYTQTKFSKINQDFQNDLNHLKTNLVEKETFKQSIEHLHYEHQELKQQLIKKWKELSYQQDEQQHQFKEEIDTYWKTKINQLKQLVLTQCIGREEFNSHINTLNDNQEVIQEELLFLKKLNQKLHRKNHHLDQEVKQIKDINQLQKPSISTQKTPEAFFDSEFKLSKQPTYPEVPAQFKSAEPSQPEPQPNTMMGIPMPMENSPASKSLLDLNHKLSHLEEKLRLKDEKVALLENYVLKKPISPYDTIVRKFRAFVEG